MKFRSILLWTLFLASVSVWADVREYKEPRVDGFRMDRCLSWGKDCDAPAAYNWCLESGYSKAIYWELENNVGKSQPTKMLKSKEICNKQGCDVFKVIVCYKNS